VPSFDIVSQVDEQEVRNAVDQASRELSTRFDFKGTETTVELNTKEQAIELQSSAEDRLNAARQVLEEKLVKRKVSLKAVEHGPVQEAGGGTYRQRSTLTAGINSDKAKEINKAIKGMGRKGVQSQTQGDQIRVTGKKRDDLQAVIGELRDADLGIPLQFENFRD